MRSNLPPCRDCAEPAEIHLMPAVFWQEPVDLCHRCYEKLLQSTG